MARVTEGTARPCHYCTYFDSRYLSRGLALYRSLRTHAPCSVLHVLCLDNATYDYLSAANLEGVFPIQLTQLEEWDADLLRVKNSRSTVEYYFTCTPAFILQLMSRVAGADSVTYVDADLYFYSTPAPIYDEIGDGSVGMIAHGFQDHLIQLEVYGIYNVGFLFFRNDANGRQCIAWWRDRCLEWCYDRVEKGRFADQKYLDDWPSRFHKVVVIQHSGAGVAPWNQARYAISVRDGKTFADGSPLVFYHFHGLRLFSRHVWMHGLADYGGRMTAALQSRIYVPYIRELRRLNREISVVAGTAAPIRYSAPSGVWQYARSIARERILVVVGPLALEMRLGKFLAPFAWFRNIVRNRMTAAGLS